jgi:rhamnose utilization protein RhaD (predicted bifunctional aldolase and dehydrogenase)
MTVKNEAMRLQYVNYLWDDEHAAKLSPREGLVYRSNLLGSDQRITNTGGGNTSAKAVERDPLTEREVEVLWVKGSGGDLRTSTVANFASLYEEKVVGLQSLYAEMSPRGPKTEAEDKMVGMYPHCAFNLNPRAASIDTPLHSFVPARHVDHMHPNAVIAVAAARRSKELTQEVFEGELGWTPWLRPGFELGLELERLAKANPKWKGVILGQHGVINWADGNKECYDLTLALIEKASTYIEARDKGEKTFGGAKHQTLDEAKRQELLFELLPWLRGEVSKARRFVATVESSAAILRFVNSRDAARLAELGTSCPDHFLRTKIKPMYIDWCPQKESAEDLKKKLAAGLDQYRKDYAA